MYKHLLEGSGNIEWMALIPLVVFVSFFIGLVLYIWFGNKQHFDQMSTLPFSDNLINDDNNEK